MASNLPYGYEDLLRAAREQYGAYVPVPSQGLTSRSVRTYGVDRDGNPILPSRQSFQQGMMGRQPSTLQLALAARDAGFTDMEEPAPTQTAQSGQPLTRDNMWFTRDAPGGGAPTQVAQRGMYGRGQPTSETWQDRFTAVTGQPLVPAPQTRNLGDFLGGLFSTTSPSGQPIQQANDSGRTSWAPMLKPRLSSSDPRMAFAGEDPNAALEAIDLLTGSGNSARPRTPPMGLMRSPVASPQPAPGNYTIRKGDTLGAIAKRSGMTVPQIMAINPQIKNANKIRAGGNLNLVGMASAPPSTPSRTSTSSTRAPSRQAIAQELSKPSGYGSKGYSAGGQMLRDLYGN